MEFVAVASLCDPGRADRPNEDRVGHGGRFAWVLDGAASPGAPRFPASGSDAAWLVARVSRSLRECARRQDASLDRLLASLDADIRRDFGAAAEDDPAGGPTCCLALAELTEIRATTIRIEAAVVADVSILVPDGGGVAVWTDDRVGAFEEKSLAALAAAPRRDAEVPAAARAQILANRPHVNVPDGYYAVSPARSWLSGVVRFSAVLPVAAPIVLVSDGFSRLADVFETMSAQALYERCAAGELPALLAELRALEAADPLAARYVRFKVHDDASALVVRAGP